MPYIVRIEYDIDLENIFHKDQEANNIAGKYSGSGGTEFVNGIPAIRDLSYEYDDLKQAEAVRDEFLLSGFKAELDS